MEEDITRIHHFYRVWISSLIIRFNWTAFGGDFPRNNIPRSRVIISQDVDGGGGTMESKDWKVQYFEDTLVKQTQWEDIRLDYVHFNANYGRHNDLCPSYFLIWYYIPFCDTSRFLNHFLKIWTLIIATCLTRSVTVNWIKFLSR